MDTHPRYDLHGRTVLLTGATQGMGRHLAHQLAASGATLLLHGRDTARLEAVIAEIRGQASTAAPVHGLLAELADLTDVRALADRVLATESRLDVLVHNAGVGGGTDPTAREVSWQGHELRFAVNHLAPHVLTRRLLPLLTTTAAATGTTARVVNVASAGQLPLDFDDFPLERDYEGVRAYCQSKLAMIMDTFDLAAELDPHEVTVNALHPAHLMDTRMVRQSGLRAAVPVEEGVRPTLRLIADREWEGVSGRYFDRFEEASAHPQAYDPTARAQLAALTRRLSHTHARSARIG